MSRWIGQNDCQSIKGRRLIRFQSTAELDQCAGLLTRPGAWNEDIRCEGACPEALAGGGKSAGAKTCPVDERSRGGWMVLEVTQDAKEDKEGLGGEKKRV